MIGATVLADSVMVSYIVSGGDVMLAGEPPSTSTTEYVACGLGRARAVMARYERIVAVALVA